MPYPNFHAARVRDPKDFDSIVVLKTLDNGIMIYGGPLKSDPKGESKTQAYRFPKDKFTVAQAKKWLKDHNIKYILFEPATDDKKSSEFEIEKRFFEVPEFRIEGDDTGKKLIGYAAVFNRFSADMGWFKEKIANGAFTETIVNDDIRGLFNHDINGLLARNKSKTLRLKEDNEGLLTEIDLPDTTLGRDIQVLVGRRDLTGMSFAFSTLKENVDHDQDPPVRTLLKVKLYDVSVVTYPAYPDTSVAVRSMNEWLKSEKQAKKSLNSMRNRLRLAEYF